MSELDSAGRYSEEEVESLLERASGLPFGEREAFLRQACGDNAALKGEVDSLLRAEEEMGDFLNQLEVDSELVDFQGVAPGRMIGPYRLLTKLGEGGMSTVFLASRADDQYRKRVAIKLAPNALVSSEHLRRFRTERHILASLAHPHIANLFDAGATEEGLPYFVMEYVEGEAIDSYCDRNRLLIRERLELFRVVCSAVHYAHQNLVVHRDLKPSNILVTADGVPKLLDFGIAKLLNPELSLPNLQPTVTWHRMLTPNYASPEQIQGKAITTASDVYSLGVLLYQLLCGRLPFDRNRKSPQEIDSALGEQEPTLPSQVISSELGAGAEARVDAQGAVVNRVGSFEPESLRRQLAGDLDNIVLKALRQEPQRRYSSVEQLAEDIRLHLKGLPVLARGDALGYRCAKFLRRHRVAVAIASLVLVLLAGFVAMMGVQAARVTRERDEARFERDKSQLALRFLEEVFAEAKSLPTEGEELTAKQIVVRAARVLEDSKNPPQVEASVMNSLGNIHRNLGLYERGEELLEGALEVREATLGSSHQDVAESLNDLSLLLIDQGEFDAAEKLLERALRIRKASFGEEHSEVAETINNLGLIQQNRGSYGAAETAFRDSLELNRRVFGGDHRYVALSLNNLATSLAQAGDYAGAESAFQEALETQRRIFLQPHPELAKTLSNLGLILQANGDIEAAKEKLLEALEYQRDLVGEEHPDVAMVMKNLGGLLDSQGEFEEAEAYLRQALNLWQGSIGREHLWSAVDRLQLAEVLSGKGDFTESRALFRESLESLSRALPPEHHFLAHPRWGLGEILLQEGKPQEALPLLRDAVEMEHRTWPDGHLDVALAESVLGDCLTRLEEFEEAESLLLRSYRLIREKRGVQSRRSKRSLERIIVLYQAWHRPDEASEFRSVLKKDFPS
ncbi:MAG: serine/threonine-protein kinase [Deltaproteobacteria bacterium]|nr:serine/threonine-protein kinase [Deltaproteobacteria bacterium]